MNIVEAFEEMKKGNAISHTRIKALYNLNLLKTQIWWLNDEGALLNEKSEPDNIQFKASSLDDIEQVINDGYFVVEDVNELIKKGVIKHEENETEE